MQTSERKPQRLGASKRAGSSNGRGPGRSGRAAISGATGSARNRKGREPAVTPSNYSMLIQWSDEDEVFICSLPEWGEGCKTHGRTYEAAAKAGREVLEMLVGWHVEEGRKLPLPRKFRDAD